VTTPRVIAVGSALLDMLAFVSDRFVQSVPGAKGGMELVDYPTMAELLGRMRQRPTLAPGGSAANTATALAQLGLPSRLLTKVGDDNNGAFYRQAVESARVETSSFKVHPTEPTGSCLSLVTPDTQRTLRTLLGAAGTLSPADITAEDFAGCTHAHIEGYLLFSVELMLHLLKTAKAANCTISIDLASPEVVKAHLAVLPGILRDYADIVFANREEACAFAQTTDEGEALSRLGGFCPVAAVKLGAQGSLLRRGNDVVRVTAKRAQAIDTTGAGDYWAAGFLYGSLNGKSLPDAGRLGSILAAAVVEQVGAGIPDAKWPGVRRELGVA